MINKAIIVAGLISFLAGCTMLRTHPAMHDELQNVADCFSDAVSILQREPSRPDDFAQFLSDAKAKQTTTTKGDFSLLQWYESGKRLHLSQGQQVLCRIAETSHDDFDDGKSATLLTYEFFTKEPIPPARTTISLYYGGKPE